MAELKGLPEGLEPVRIGKAEQGEYIYDLGLGIRGPADDRYHCAGLVVRLAPGYEFHYDIGSDETWILKALDRPKVLTATFRIESSRDEQRVRSALSRLPGWQGTLEKDA